MNVCEIVDIDNSGIGSTSLMKIVIETHSDFALGYFTLRVDRCGRGEFIVNRGEKF